MERGGVAVAAQALADANHKLEVLLQILGSAQELHTISAEHMAAALAEVVCVGEWLRAGLAQNAEGPMAEELERYRAGATAHRASPPGGGAGPSGSRRRLGANGAPVGRTGSLFALLF
jgi:folate-dependent tRNA-U54 methylase TrmFO/GidA